MLSRMASILDSLRNLGRSAWSYLSEGAARSITSFVERLDRNNSLIYQQRAHLPRGNQRRMSQRHLTGERMFSEILRGYGFGTGYGMSWTQDRTRQVAYFRRWVYVGSDVICSTMAGLPFQFAYKRPRKKRKKGEAVEKSGMNRRHGRARRRARQKYYEARYRKSLHAIKPHEEIEPVPEDHPCVTLFKKPNAWVPSGGQLLYQTVLFLILTGNAYWWVVPDRAFGRPMEIWCIPSHWVQGPELGPAGEKLYRIMPFMGRGGFTIPADEIVHFAFPNPLSPIDGQSPIQAISPWIDISESIDNSRYWTFKKGNQATGAIELGPTYDPDKMDIDEIGEQFLARYGSGEATAGSLVVMPPDAKMVPLTISPKDMAFEGGFEQCRDAILAALHIGKGLVGITDPGSDRALWGERSVYYEHAIIPRLRYIDEVVTTRICKRWDDELIAYHDDPTPPDPQQINADLALDLQHFVRTPNEVRSVRGLEPIDDPLMDQVWISQGLQPMSAVKEQLEQQKQQAQQAAMQQQMQAQQPPGGESMQQQQQGSFAENGEGPQADAQDAALAVNDAAWQDEGAAVQKAHEYNQRFQAAGHGWRLTYDSNARRWKAHSPAAKKAVRSSSNGDGEAELVAAAMEFLHGGDRNGSLRR